MGKFSPTTETFQIRGIFMSDYLSQFINFMRSVDCAPESINDIVADDERHYFQIEGDKRGIKKGVYSLLIDDNGAVGWCKNYREGVNHGWSSKAKKEWSEQEKADWKAKTAEKKAKNDADVEKLRAVAAKKSNDIFKRSKQATVHKYLERKGVKSTGAYICDNVKLREDLPEINNALIIPAYKNGKISTIQVITEDGDKLFFPDGDIKGAYGVIKTSQDMSILYICEGFATGGSINEATGKNVIIAFNAGNLKPVTLAINAKYPDAKIVIAADNDAWRFKYPRNKAVKDINRDEVATDDPRWKEWLENGYLENKGILEARQAAIAIGGASVVYPEFETKDGKLTDWNDAHKVYGLDWIRIRLEAISTDRAIVRPEPLLDTVVSIDDSPPLFPEVPIEAYYDIFESREIKEKGDWRELLICSGEGKLNKSSLKNTILFLGHHDDFKGVFVYNEFNKQISVVKCPKWDSEQSFVVHELNDIDISQTAAAIEAFGLAPDTTRVHKAIEVVANINKVHPAREYFNSLEWDGVNRLDNWLSYYFGCESESQEYLSFVGKKWLTAAVKRIYEPACKFDHILVLEGKQGIGKSTALRTLATFSGVSYFKDGITIADIQSKDTIMQMQGCIIIELAELAGFSKKDDDELKRWITIQHDDCRLPYARTTSRFDRQFVLAATTNNYEYLKDPTGNRRYWPIMCGKIDGESLQKNCNKLWAEAVALYKSGLYIGPTQEEMELATKEQAKRLASDAWEDDVIKAMKELGHKASMQAIMVEMGIVLRDRDSKSARRISYILGKNGYESKSVYDNGTTRRMWVRV